MSKRVHVLIGIDGTSAIIGFYLDSYKVRQLYMTEKIPLKAWLPEHIRYWKKECKAKVTVSKL